MTVLRSLVAVLAFMWLSSSALAQNNCIIPRRDLIFSLPRDAIPALNYPDVVSAEDADAFLDPVDLVLGVEMNGEARAYPLSIMQWHEVVNDLLGGKLFAVNYCPLTGSGLVYSSKVGSEFVLFGVSGLLYDNNNVMFDRTSNSLWSQMSEQAVCGTLAGEKAQLYPLVQSTWWAWKKLHPDTTVVSLDTGFDRNYDVNPYIAYNRLDNTELFFPQSFVDLRRPMKEVVFGIEHDGLARAYPYPALGHRVAINDVVNGLPVLVVYDEDARMVIAFERELHDDDLTLVLDVVDEPFPFRMTDRETGTFWSLTGMAVEGPLAGARLEPIATYSSMWFAWAAFHRGTQIYTPE